MRYNEGLIEGSGRIETVTEFRGVRMTDDAAGDELYRSKNISLDTFTKINYNTIRNQRIIFHSFLQ